MTNLGKVYSWYFKKLESIGQMTGSEKDEEEMFLNPGKIEEIQRRKHDQQEQKRSKLMNENVTMMKDRKMFEEGERSVH